MEWIRIPEKNLPSTYQQVIRNMLYIQEEIVPVVESVHEIIEPEVERHSRYIEEVVEPAIEDIVTTLDPAVKKLNDTIFNPDAGNKSDVVMGSDGIMKVIGMRTESLSGDKAGSSAIESHGRNAAFGVISAESAGLAGRFGVNSEYVTLFTMIPSDGAPAWQFAVGDDAVGGAYVRTADETGGWGEWMRATHKPYMYSVNPPKNKLDVGECWIQEVYPPSKYHLSDVTDPLNLDYIDINEESWGRISAVRVDTGEEIAPPMEDIDLMDLVGTLSFIDLATNHEYDFTVDSMEEFTLQNVDDDTDETPFKPDDVSFINVPLSQLSSATESGETGLNNQDALQPIDAGADSEDGLIDFDLEDVGSYILDSPVLGARV